MPTDPIAPPVNAGKSPQTAPGQRARRSGLGWSSQIIMGSIVLTLLAIALPKQCTQNFPFLPVPLSAPAAKPALIPIPAPSSVPTVVAAPSWPAPVDDAKAISDIAKMTLDASKDKYDSIKDTYDKLFSVLAAMAALLAFLGFKGLDSLVAARNEAQASEQLAQAALASALAAEQRAKDAEEKVLNFLDEIYPRNNKAEINVSHGIALREMASVYKHAWEQNHPADAMSAPAQAIYSDYLNKSLYYLDAALRQNGKDKLDGVLVRRAMGTQCNVYRRMDDFDRALLTAQEIIRKFEYEDESAFYNAACYCALIAERHQRYQENDLAEKFKDDALGYLATAVKLLPANKAEVLRDRDFHWLMQVRPTLTATILA